MQHGKIAKKKVKCPTKIAVAQMAEHTPCKQDINKAFQRKYSSILPLE
jgi:hypothetical protein